MCTYNAISSHTDHFEIQKRDSEESLLTFVNLSFSKLLKEAAEARPCLHLSKCQIVGNRMHWLEAVHRIYYRESQYLMVLFSVFYTSQS